MNGSEPAVSAAVFTQHYSSPLGGITLASDGEALTGLWFDGQRYFAAGLGTDREEADLPVFTAAKRWLDAYFSGQRPDFLPPLRMFDTAFRVTVWEALLAVPYGETVSYAALAAAVAARLGRAQVPARAVGGAVGRNPISLIVPCHRVIGADGRLTGYAGGLDLKARLLQLEKADPRR